MIPLLLFLLFVSIIFNAFLIYKVKLTRKENLIVFREKLKVNDVALLQEWDDTLDKCVMQKVTIIRKGTYIIKVIDENMKYHDCNPEDLFPINYHVCRDN